MLDLFSQIVNEATTPDYKLDLEDRIKSAIENVRRVRMYYDDKQGGKGKNERFILPVAFGLTKSGKKAVRAYETMGSSKRGLTNPPNRRKIPKWKLFLVDGIVSWSNGKKTFADYKNALISLGLNTHGDKSMTTLFAITPFADDNVQVAKNTDTITNGPVNKSDVEPTQKLQSPKTTDKEKFIPAAVSREKTVDNTNKGDYFKDKTEAPDTEPVSKQQVSNEPQVVTNNDAEKMSGIDGPVTKNDISTGDSHENIDDVKAKFNDMVQRMDNVNKDEDEE